MQGKTILNEICREETIETIFTDVGSNDEDFDCCSDIGIVPDSENENETKKYLYMLIWK